MFDSKTAKIVLQIVLILFFSLFFFRKIHFPTADLGRHIKNGQILLESFEPIKKSFYSYTQPEFPTINHHWATGIVFFLIWKIAGFSGLSIFYVGIHVITFILFFYIAKKESNVLIATLVSLLALPLIIHRREIRPEGFSYLLLSIYFYLLYLFRSRKISIKSLFLLPLLQIFWVNLHLYFIFGHFIIGVFMLDDFLFGGKKNLKVYLSVLFLTSLASLVNPSFIAGALVPLNIFKEYGYMLVENQSIMFLQKRFFFPQFFHFEIIVAILLQILLFTLNKKDFIKRFVYFIPVLFFGILTWKVSRAITLFGFVMIPFTAVLFFELVERRFHSLRRVFYKISFSLSLLLIFFSILSPGSYYSPFDSKFGVGLEKDVEKSAEFFIENNIKGPIFNNYDIGGYLIYYLYPDHRVFVDNRPEAYSVDFFQLIYISMQTDEDVWKKINDQYGFNVIYFYRNDATPWAQPFLLKRIQDPLWAAVFVDADNLILLKRNADNAGVIAKYEMPKEYFGVF